MRTSVLVLLGSVLAPLAACGGASAKGAPPATPPSTSAAPPAAAAAAAPEPTDEEKCAKGDGAACTSAGRDAEFGRKDEEAARALYEKGCALNDGGGCSAAALYERDPQRKQMLEEKACDEGDGSTCFDLGTAAIDAHDGVSALRYLKRACASAGSTASGPACELVKKLEAP